MLDTVPITFEYNCKFESRHITFGKSYIAEDKECNDAAKYIQL